MNKLLTFLLLFGLTSLLAQENINNNKFKQLNNDLPTPNSYRSASGAPGHEYWQQRANYNMKIRIDDQDQKLFW